MDAKHTVYAVTKANQELQLTGTQARFALAPEEALNIETRAEIFEKLGKRDQTVAADYPMVLKLIPAYPNTINGLKRLGVTP